MLVQSPNFEIGTLSPPSNIDNFLFVNQKRFFFQNKKLERSDFYPMSKRFPNSSGCTDANSIQIHPNLKRSFRTVIQMLTKCKSPVVCDWEGQATCGKTMVSLSHWQNHLLVGIPHCCMFGALWSLVFVCM